MTGKLFLADGDNYGFYPRRAKAVAEVADYIRKNGIRVSGAAIPDPVPIDGVCTFTLVTGSSRDFVVTPTAETDAATVLDDLAALVAADVEIAFASRLEGDIAVIPALGVSLTSGEITYTAPPPPP